MQHGSAAEKQTKGGKTKRVGPRRTANVTEIWMYLDL